MSDKVRRLRRIQTCLVLLFLLELCRGKIILWKRVQRLLPCFNAQLVLEEHLFMCQLEFTESKGDSKGVTHIIGSGKPCPSLGIAWIKPCSL